MDPILILCDNGTRLEIWEYDGRVEIELKSSTDATRVQGVLTLGETERLIAVLNTAMAYSKGLLPE